MDAPANTLKHLGFAVLPGGDNRLAERSQISYVHSPSCGHRRRVGEPSSVRHLNHSVAASASTYKGVYDKLISQAPTKLFAWPRPAAATRVHLIAATI